MADHRNSDCLSCPAVSGLVSCQSDQVFPGSRMDDQASLVWSGHGMSCFPAGEVGRLSGAHFARQRATPRRKGSPIFRSLICYWCNSAPGNGDCGANRPGQIGRPLGKDRAHNVGAY